MFRFALCHSFKSRDLLCALYSNPETLPELLEQMEGAVRSGHEALRIAGLPNAQITD